ncbi:MAG TPA: hypothetical protein VK421_15760 [Pyrinomonadaceae bacterium]|nr:hypothetical protein [Pyrinomonadaceae bacterium]
MRMLLLVPISLMLYGASSGTDTRPGPCASGPLTEDEIREVGREVEALSGSMSHVDTLKRLGVWKHYSKLGGHAGGNWISYYLGSCHVLVLYGSLECVERVKLSREGRQIRVKDLPGCPEQHNNGMHPTRISAAVNLNLAGGRVMPGVRQLSRYEAKEVQRPSDFICEGPSRFSGLRLGAHSHFVLRTLLGVVPSNCCGGRAAPLCQLD